MADEGSSLFCDEDETCDKNISESDEDGEEYVSAPIGKIVVALSAHFTNHFEKFVVLFSHPRFGALLYIFTGLLRNFTVLTRSFDERFHYLLVLLSRQAWASRKMASAQTS